MTLDVAPTLTGPRLTLTPLTDADRDALFDAAADPLIWEQHPAPDRYRRPIFESYFDGLLNAGGTLIARDGNTVIGCSRFYAVPDLPGDWAIGFTFLRRSHWGGDWNREMKALMVGHVLSDHHRVWFHIAPGNLRSQIATTRLGARHAFDSDLDLGAGPVPYRCYTLTATDWEQATGHSMLAHDNGLDVEVRQGN